MRDVVAEIWFSSCVTTTAEPLIHYLHQLQAQGKTHVKIDDDARILLREFYKRAMGKSTRAATRPNVAEIPTPVSKAPEPQAPVGLQVTGNTREEKLSSLKHQAKNWAPAMALGGFRKTMVFSAGNPQANIMLVGEAPGFDEERLLEPFSGKAGQKLDAILRAMGTDRKDVYISNIVKYRPQMPNQTTNNRQPTRDELNVWLPFLEKEIQIVAPQVIIALGGASAQAMLGVEKSVGDLRGEFHRYGGIPLRVTYHPSYILNDESTPEKRKLWLDMLSVMELLGMPVSDKQRGYFSKQP